MGKAVSVYRNLEGNMESFSSRASPHWLYEGADPVMEIYKTPYFAWLFTMAFLITHLLNIFLFIFLVLVVAVSVGVVTAGIATTGAGAVVAGVVTVG